MSYSFVDTIAAGGVPGTSPEALTLNGVDLENAIAGFRVLNVTGRELMSQTVEDYKIGTTPGTQYRSRTYPSRTITVTYQLLTDSDGDYREAFNLLNSYLDVEQVRAIFADEPDKFFIVTSTAVSAPKAGRNKVTGTFSLYCTDPRKYAVTPKTFTATGSGNVLTATVINEGTVGTPIDYDITHTGENGYVAITNNQGETLAYGSPNELDFDTATKSEVLSNLADGAAIISGSATGGTGGVEVTANGSLRAKTVSGTSVAYLYGAGSGTRWHGGSRQINLSESSTDFTCVAKAFFEATGVNQSGLLWLVISGGTTASPAEMCSIFVQKIPGTYGAFATCRVPANAQKIINFNASPGKGFGMVNKPDGLYLRVIKSGGKFSFCVGGTVWDVELPAFANTEAVSCTLFIGQYGTQANLVNELYFKSFSFVKNNVEYAVDVPNRYQAGDVLQVNGAEAQMYLNGEPNAADEITGSQYFEARPGTNVINIASSDWASGVLTAQASIREAWL